MNKTEINIVPRIDWDKVSSNLEVNNITQDLYHTFLEIVTRLKNASDIEISSESWVIFHSLMMEVACDLILVLAIEPGLFFSMSFNMKPKNVGRSLRYQSGKTTVLLNGHCLLEAAKCINAVRSLDDSVEVSPEMLVPLVTVIEGLAHELGHIRIMQRYPEKMPKSTQSWDMDGDAPSSRDIAAYIHHPIEAHAVAVAIRYLRRKQEVGETVWQALPIDELAKSRLNEIMLAGQILDKERVTQLIQQLNEDSANLSTLESKALQVKLFLVLSRAIAAPQNAEKMRQRIDELIGE